MVNFRELSEAEYNSFNYALLKQVEGAEPEAYVDTAGIPTIGIGFNLRAHMGAVRLCCTNRLKVGAPLTPDRAILRPL
jgi:GH24 family phage-related lysozyme (muramidase)